MIIGGKKGVAKKVVVEEDTMPAPIKGIGGGIKLGGGVKGKLAGLAAAKKKFASPIAPPEKVEKPV